MSGLTFALYHGAGRWDDRLVRFRTGSIYSHVELLQGDDGYGGRRAISSSGRDGGVRIKHIDFHPDRWDMVRLEGWCRPDAWERACRHLGAPYDWSGILGTFGLPIWRQSREAWWCSELLAYAVGLSHPWVQSPGTLSSQAHDLNHAFALGLNSAALQPAFNADATPTALNSQTALSEKRSAAKPSVSDCKT